MRRQLTREWSIELDDTFASRVVDGNLRAVSPGPPVRTTRVAVWDTTPGRSVAEVVEMCRTWGHTEPKQRFDEPGTDEGEWRIGTWYPESVEGRAQWGLYGYTVRPGSCVQIALLVDHEDDLPWALTTWRSLRSTSPGPAESR